MYSVEELARIAEAAVTGAQSSIPDRCGVFVVVFERDRPRRAMLTTSVSPDIVREAVIGFIDSVTMTRGPDETKN